ncbi:type VI secretion system baseplate subunit TssE [Xenorhabdus bharatensis]|uniref:type VI secretion system baseplate subunit TssE n=1 Tax=Xenorhabdus bharatensis TaxID=3136256 RepID=UPI0030F4B279
MNHNTSLIRSSYRHPGNTKHITARDKMQPSLLDRLTDNEPDKKKEANSNHLISHSVLRRSLLRDLQWLLNSINSEATQNLSPFPEIRHSVYNFGLAPLAGKLMSEIEWEDIQHKITKAIQTFEPRIILDGLEVNCVSDTDSLTLYNRLSIEIRGFLWCVPWPVEFVFHSDVDLENGYFTIKEAG